MKKGSFWKNYGFLILMLTGIVAGCVVGAIWPAVKDASGEVIVKGATVLEPLGTVFLNLMFCIAVPPVFCSISSSIANMQSAKRAGKIMGVTIATFLTTAAIAAVIMYVTVLLIPPVTGEYAMIEGEVGGTLGVADMIVNFFTKPDFTELFSRKAILPLIVAAVLFGFGVQMAGGAQAEPAQLLEQRRADALHIQQLLDGGKAAVGIAVAEDPVRRLFADAGKRKQLFSRGGIEAELPFPAAVYLQSVGRGCGALHGDTRLSERGSPAEEECAHEQQHRRAQRVQRRGNPQFLHTRASI